MSSTDNNEWPEYIYVTDVLDLHGTPVSVIPQMMDDFIENALLLGFDRVRIIHGKGRSKLKHFVYRLLQKHANVSDYYDAPPALGGWGATIAELTKQ